jgi:uncharacterized membrane protein YuzA (DUF378 family)
VAFFFKNVGGSAAFWAGLLAQTLVLVLFATLGISYLWYNLIGCAAVIVFSIALQKMLSAMADKNAHSL